MKRATEAATKAEEDRRKKLRVDATMVNVGISTRAQGRGIVGSAKDALLDELAVEKQVRDALVSSLKAQADAEKELGSDEIDALRRSNQKIADLERQVELTEELGNIIEAMIGDVAVGAYDAWTDAMETSIDTQKFAAKSLLSSLRNMIAGVIRTIGEKAAIKGAEEIAEAYSSIAGEDYKGAAMHGSAAAQWFGVAAAAGVASAAMSTGGGGRGSVALPGQDSEGNGGTRIVQQITIIGTLDTRDAESLAEQLQHAQASRDLDS